MRNKLVALKNAALTRSIPLDYDHIKTLINNNADSEALVFTFQNMIGASPNNAIFKYRGHTLIKAMMLCLTELHDKGMITLSINVIKESLSLEKHIEMLSLDISLTTKKVMSDYLASIGYVEGRPRPMSCNEQHGHARSYFSVPLQLLSEMDELDRTLSEHDYLVSCVKNNGGDSGVISLSGETQNSFIGF